MVVDTPVGTTRVDGEPTRRAAAAPHTLTKSRYQSRLSRQSDKWRKRSQNLWGGQGECTTRHVAGLDLEKPAD